MTIIMKSFSHLFICSFLLLSQSLWAAQTVAIDSIVALIEDDVILASELDRAEKVVMASFEGQDTRLPPRNVIRKQVLERLILTKLQVQRAHATGIRVNDQDVDRAIRAVAQRNNLTVAQLRETLAQDGLEFSGFWEKLRDEITISRLNQRVARSRVEVTESEVDILLAGEEANSGEYRLAHILIAVPQGADPDTIEAAAHKTDQVYQRILGGMDFTEAAITYSDSPNALEGGDLGWRPSSKLPLALGDSISNTPVGSLTEPVRGPGGFHIIKVVEFRAAQRVMVQEYKASHILIKASELVSPLDALERINVVKRRIDNGEDFASVAKETSEDTATANQGGDMGWLSAEAFGAQVRDVIINLPPGGVSEPFQTSLGWHVAMLYEARKQDRTDELKRAQGRDAIHARKSEEEIEIFLRTLRDEAFVEYRIET